MMTMPTAIIAALLATVLEGGPTISAPLPVKTENGNVLYILWFSWYPDIQPPHKMTEVSWDDPTQRRDVPPPEGHLDPGAGALWRESDWKARAAREARLSVLLDQVIPAYFARTPRTLLSEGEEIEERGSPPDAPVDGKQELLVLLDSPLMPYYRVVAADFFDWLEQKPYNKI
jgi:hypothetical protein